MPLGISFFIPPLCHFVTPLLKERLLYGSHWGEPVTQLTVGWLVRIFIWLLFFIVSFSTTPSLRDTSPQGEAFCTAPSEGSRQRSRLWGGLFIFSYDCYFLSYHFPPLRHFVTPLLKERHLYGTNWGGADDAVDCGVAYSHFHMTVIFYRIVYHHSVTSWHLSSRRGICMAPIEGSCQRSRLWGGFL